MKTRPLDQNEIDGLAYYRTWVNDILTRGFGVEYAVDGSEEDVPYLDLVLSKGPYTESPADELTILGSVLGDVIARMLGMEWIVFTDEEGTSFALAHPTKHVYSFPQDLLLKRAEKGTLGTISELYGPLVDSLRSEIEHAKDRA